MSVSTILDQIPTDTDYGKILPKYLPNIAVNAPVTAISQPFNLNVRPAVNKTGSNLYAYIPATGLAPFSGFTSKVISPGNNQVKIDFELFINNVIMSVNYANTVAGGGLPILDGCYMGVYVTTATVGATFQNYTSANPYIFKLMFNNEFGGVGAGVSFDYTIDQTIQFTDFCTLPPSGSVIDLTLNFAFIPSVGGATAATAPPVPPSLAYISGNIGVSNIQSFIFQGLSTDSGTFLLKTTKQIVQVLTP